MKTIYKNYKFQIKPNKEQEVLLNKHFGSVRFVYNHFLNQRKLQYQENKKADNYNKQSSKLTLLKKEEDFNWLSEINSQSLQSALRNLDTAYLNFFRGKLRFPKFKSKRNRNQSFTVPQHTSIENGKVYFPKFKDGISVIQHRDLEGKIGKFTLSKTPTNKYFVSIQMEVELPEFKVGKKAIGIDLGIKNIAITSDGKLYKNHIFTKRYETKLKDAQQHLSRKKSGSNSFEKQRRKVALIHEKISNCRKDNLHKITKEIVSNYDLIVVEDLQVTKMMKSKLLSKLIADVSWFEFVRQLTYKSGWNGKQLVKVDRYYPSSKTCSNCGFINQSLKLSDRIWTCNECQSKLDRDLNASINILKEGINKIGVELADYTSGEDVILSNQLFSAKLEAMSFRAC